jgi:hypothetical protein
MFNEQGCRIRAKIGPIMILLRRTILVWDSGIRLRSRYRRDGLVMANRPAAVREVAQAIIIPALLRRHFFRFIPVCKAANVVVWNHLKKRFFLLHLAPVLPIQWTTCPASVSSSHDRLFLQRLHRPRRAQRRERRADAAAHAGADLWMPGLQRPVRPVRPHHQEDHGRSARRLRQGVLFGMSAQPRSCGIGCPRRVFPRRVLEPESMLASILAALAARVALGKHLI